MGPPGDLVSRGIVPSAINSPRRWASGVLNMWWLLRPGLRSSCAAIGLFGLLSFVGPSESPQEAIDKFARAFSTEDADSLLNTIHPDIIDGKEVSKQEVGSFLERYRGRSQHIQSFRIDKRLTSEEGVTERFQATLLFKGPSLAPELPAPINLEMVLLWVREQKRWWLERPLSVRYRVTSSVAYPTPEQDELAMRLQQALEVLDKVGLRSPDEDSLIGGVSTGSAAEEYRELEKLHKTEKGPKGIDPNATGVKVFLRAAARAPGALLRLYHGDFPGRETAQRTPVPWTIFANYADAAIRQGKQQEQRGNTRGAEATYRKIICFGRQFLDEPGGLLFLIRGTTLQKMGSQELARLFTARRLPDAEKAKAFSQLCSRRLDLLETVLSCLDSLADYGALKAAIIAAERDGDRNFRPWGINTLAIFALQGAPARSEVIKQAGGFVLVSNPVMQTKASDVLDRLASDPSGRMTSFIEDQKNWIRTHDVYAAVRAFR